MNPDKQPGDGGKPLAEEQFRRRLAARRSRFLRARQQGERPAWFGLGMFGLVGWSVAIPTVSLTALGVWVDRRWPGPYSWALMLLVIGMALGCLNAWIWVSRERRDIEGDRSRPLKEEQDDRD
ncbi:MAG: F0F1 ATP synthase subunit [Desulfuromonadales bacterium C00003096]|jgi:ATP synthase protein I|nr:MAG: F0F1 ATP synthase subunit [Desulfuromonadales bacterium C00003096]